MQNSNYQPSLFETPVSALSLFGDSQEMKIELGGDPIGTCLRGYVHTKYEDIVKLLGEPDPDNCDGYKTDAEWTFKVNGKTLTLYNYKTGKNYLGDEGQETEDITHWHIGGQMDGDITEEMKFLATKLNGQLEDSY